MKDEVLKLALEALEREEYRLRQTGQSQVYSGIGFAITAIKQALAAQPTVQEPVASLNEVDVLMMAETHGIDPNTKGLYGFYIDCISNHPTAQPAVPDALNPKDENPAYAAGWNDCRAEMLKGMK
jgi:hypothetical protein